MSDLADVFGEDLAKQVQEKTAEKRQERNKVTEEQMAKICAMAIQEQKFEDGEPQFKFKTDNGVTHTVLLMQVPELNSDKTVWDFLDEPWEGAARLPLDYLGDWMNCTFPDKNLVAKFDAGDWVIVVGAIDTYEKDNGEVVESVYPVRGLATLEEAKEYAQGAMDSEGFAKDGDDEEEQEEETTETEEFASDEEDGTEEFASDDDDVEEDDDDEEESEEAEEDDPFGGVSSDDDDDDDEEESSGSSSAGGLKALAGMDDDDDEEEEEEEEPPVDYEEVAEFVETLSEKQDEDEEPQIMDLERGMDQFSRLVDIACSQLEEDNEEGVAEVIEDVIEGHGEDEEEEEDEDDELEGKIF